MRQLAVFVKRNGVLIACRAYPAPDGATWQCGACDFHPLLRASFGVMSGLWRCQCGAEVELMVDGEPVAIEEVAEIMPAPAEIVPEQANVDAKPKRKRKLKDADFLRECGIAIEEEKPCSTQES